MADDSGPIPPTPWQRAQAGRRAARSERAGARLDGGQTQPASGSKWQAPGDYRTATFLVEDKTTDARSYTITADVLDKINRQAMLAHGRLPQLRISMPGHVVRVIREEDWLALFGG